MRLLAKQKQEGSVFLPSLIHRDERGANKGLMYPGKPFAPHVKAPQIPLPLTCPGVAISTSLQILHDDWTVVRLRRLELPRLGLKWSGTGKGR
jgi:hypothetical protein